MAGHRSNQSILNELWSDAGDNTTELKQEPAPTSSSIRIQVTGPSGSTINQGQPTQIASQLPTQNGIIHAIPESKEPPQPQEQKPEPPTLVESAAFSTLRMFHEMGLGGDSEDIFMNEMGMGGIGDDIFGASASGISLSQPIPTEINIIPEQKEIELINNTPIVIQKN
eukprot:816585_1